MVNNAGNIGPVGHLWDNNPEDWARTVAVHLLGTFYGCRAVLPKMLERGSGRIVNMSGVGGPYSSCYDAVKSGIVSLTENLALELADTAITVNAISPGSIHTRMWEENRDLALAVGGHRDLRARGAGNLRARGVHRAGRRAGGVLGERRLRKPVGPLGPRLR